MSRSAKFWTGPFSIGLGIIIGGLLAYGWTIFGGFPVDADRYGRVPVPGKKVVELPEGIVPLDHDNLMEGGGETRSLADRPDGLAIQITPANGDGGALPVESVPSWLFTSSSGDRGHEPYGRIDVPKAGRYLVKTEADGPSGDPQIVLGAAPWNPGGSVYAGAALAFLVVFFIAVLPALIIRRFVK